MSTIQRQALQMMSDENRGAIVTRFGWTWPCDIRQSDEKAQAVVDTLTREAGRGWEAYRG